MGSTAEQLRGHLIRDKGAPRGPRQVNMRFVMEMGARPEQMIRGVGE